MIGTCVICSRPNKALAKGMCRGCYSKWSYTHNPKRKQSQLRLINEYNLNIKKMLVSWLGNKECFFCRVTNLPYSAYEFHHVLPSHKDFMIGKLPKSIPKVLENEVKIREELSKCVIVCANCHRIIHSSEYGCNKSSFLNYVNKSYFKNEGGLPNA